MGGLSWSILSLGVAFLDTMGLEFAKTVKEAFATNLAKNIKVTASNVRDNNSAYGADKTIDGNNQTYWCTDEAHLR